MADLTYRKALASDTGYLLWLRKQTMDEHLLSSGMSLTDEDHLARVYYHFHQAQIIIYEGQDIGLLKVDETAGNLEIVQIQLDPAYQGRGLGQQIITTVIAHAKGHHKSVSLSVLQSNKAHLLYLRMGFNIISQDEKSFVMFLAHHEAIVESGALE